MEDEALLHGYKERKDQGRRATYMRKSSLIPAILLCCVLFAGTGDLCAADNMEMIKKEQSAMNAVIEQFARDKNICNDDEEQIRFAISPYKESRDPSRWTDEVRNNIAACREKYMVNMDNKGTQSVYLYCFDGQVPKLVAPAPESAEIRKNCSQGK
jgi:hypothetical protein